MVGKLLAALRADLAYLDSDLPITTRPMLGGNGTACYVEDAQTAVDTAGRKIIPAADVVANAVRTAFGMGGTYVDGAIVIAVAFTDQLLDQLIIDRFPSLITNFKIATADIQSQGLIYAS